MKGGLANSTQSLAALAVLELHMALQVRVVVGLVVAKFAGYLLCLLLWRIFVVAEAYVLLQLRFPSELF